MVDFFLLLVLLTMPVLTRVAWGQYFGSSPQLLKEAWQGEWTSTLVFLTSSAVEHVRDEEGHFADFSFAESKKSI